MSTNNQWRRKGSAVGGTPRYWVTLGDIGLRAMGAPQPYGWGGLCPRPPSSAAYANNSEVVVDKNLVFLAVPIWAEMA